MDNITEGITVVSPMYGDRNITDRMVFSVLHQFICKDNPFKIHLVLVDDYIEKRMPHPKKRGTRISYYDYYTSEEFKSFYDTENIEISIIMNSKHKYQGESREIGYKAGNYPFFVLIDCDDMLAPNALDRFMNIIRREHNQNNFIACICGLLYGFDTNGSETVINGNNIWVQGRCYNRDFLYMNDIHFPTGLNSKQGEDYPFIRKLDYAINHCENWNLVELDYDNPSTNTQCTAYWFPNRESLSRKDPFYSQHLSGWTMASSNSILDFFEEYNKKHGFEDDEDEFMKHEFLNMAIYAFYNLLDFLKTVSITNYIPLKEDWEVLRDNVSLLRKRLKNKYWSEIVYSDIEDMLYNVKHNSDVRFCESFIGTFFDYMAYETVEVLTMDYDQMMDHCKNRLKFDTAHHEIHSPYVTAWNKRHYYIKRSGEKIDLSKLPLLIMENSEIKFEFYLDGYDQNIDHAPIIIFNTLFDPVSLSNLDKFDDYILNDYEGFEIEISNCNTETDSFEVKEFKGKYELYFREKFYIGDDKTLVVFQMKKKD